MVDPDPGHPDGDGPSTLSADAARLFQELPFIGMAVTSPASKRWLQVNQTLCDMLGYPRAELVERTWAELTHPDDIAADAAEFARVMAGDIDGYKMDKRFIRRDGGVVHATIDVKAIRRADGAVDVFLATIADITARVAAEAALRESEQRYRILVEHAPEAIVVYDVDADRFTDANRNAERLFGLSHAELLQRGVAGVSPARQADGRASAEAGAAWIGQALAGDAPAFEWLHQHASGREIPCEVRLSALPFAGRRVVRGSMTDVTERNRARDTQRRLEAAIDSAMSGIALADLDGRLTYVNRAFLALWGNTHADEVLGRSALSLWRSPEEAAVVIAATARGPWTGELVARRVDGTERTLLITTSVVPDATGAPSGMMGSFIDVTEAKALQAQLAQAQRLETVGRLAGGIAHDFNNLLTVIKGYLAVALGALPADSHIREDLIEVDRAADSATTLTRQLLAFSRRQVIAPVVLDLNLVVRRVHGMLQRVLGEDIVLQVATDPSLRRVRFDPGQAEQILVNLAVNARDAMPAGGRLTVETANVRIDDDDRRSHGEVVPGDYVLLVVSDDGAGMTDEIRRHAFEPFYTTKSAGTGLGLAMIHGAVSQNGGRIELCSEPGHGTSFKIYLPSTSEPAAPLANARGPALLRGTETVMVVEDEASVRALAVLLLERLGYRVHAFASGVDALAWLGATTETIALLVTDVIMPGMNGKDLAERVVAARPATRVLFVSGYTADVIVHHGVLKPGLQFLAKPYTIAALATRVRELLDPP